MEQGLRALGYPLELADRFDTVTVHCASAPAVHRAAAAAGFNLRVLPDGAAPADATGFGISLDELSDQQELQALLALLAEACGQATPQLEAEQHPSLSLPQRSQPWLSQPVFISTAANQSCCATSSGWWAVISRWSTG